MMVENGTFSSVILHEMGHVLGIGTLWDGFLSNWNGLSVDDTRNRDPRLLGSNAALAVYKELTGRNDATDIPLEDTGGPGTYAGHWRESELDIELMTGYAESGAMPLSKLTVAILQDLGYTTQPAYDSFSIPGQPQVRSAFARRCRVSTPQIKTVPEIPKKKQQLLDQ
eukprot:TRINITY_DN52197_c0_g1_i1.p2 TRINITY_DN52197_c0_g1~~TRINITY_DN52197_c0_g1_i1.p2  ORF type:complete len:179 (+),score=22.88 TRINITY_DN52197_c0_g1_i1:36-539(+)